MVSSAQLVEKLLRFPAADRAKAARALLESLDGAEQVAEVEATWPSEIERRVREIEDGSVELEDGPTTMRELRARAQARVKQTP